MEVSRRYTIAFKGLKPGDHHFDFEVDDALFEAFESPEIKHGRCAVSVDLHRAETFLKIGVSIRGEVAVECDRCLEECAVPVDYTGELTVKFSDAAGEYDGEVLWLSPGDSEVDLSLYIYESIVLALPYRRVHPEGGCDPTMLARFRVADEAGDAVE